jgi:hypothetical protein
MSFPRRARASPQRCRPAKGLDCVFPIWFTQYAVFGSHMPCRAHTAPMPCHDHAVLKATYQGHGTARHGHGMACVKLASAFQRRHVGDLPAFGFFRLPRGVPRRLSEAYQSIKVLDLQFGYFRLPRGLSRRTRHCRRMAGARHGMFELGFSLA